MITSNKKSILWGIPIIRLNNRQQRRDHPLRMVIVLILVDMLPSWMAIPTRGKYLPQGSRIKAKWMTKIRLMRWKSLIMNRKYFVFLSIHLLHPSIHPSIHLLIHLLLLLLFLYLIPFVCSIFCSKGMEKTSERNGKRKNKREKRKKKRNKRSCKYISRNTIISQQPPSIKSIYQSSSLSHLSLYLILSLLQFLYRPQNWGTEKEEGRGREEETNSLPKETRGRGETKAGRTREEEKGRTETETEETRGRSCSQDPIHVQGICR